MKNNTGLEYQMTKEMFDSILATRTEAEKKQNPYNYVMDTLNREGNFLGTIKRLSIMED